MGEDETAIAPPVFRRVKFKTYIPSRPSTKVKLGNEAE
jgi:hypothetical protein